MQPRVRRVVTVATWMALAACGLLGLAIVWGVAGYDLPFSFPDTEITQQEPYADFVGREYRVTSEVRAHAWNDFPDRDKILSITLMPPPGVRNRFVSSVTPLRVGQTIRIVSAWRTFALIEFSRYYVVSVPGAGLQEGVPVKMAVNSDGVPDPRVYEPIDR